MNVYGVTVELDADWAIGVTVQPGTPGTGIGTPAAPRPATNGFGPDVGTLAIAAVASGRSARAGRREKKRKEEREMKRDVEGEDEDRRVGTGENRLTETWKGRLPADATVGGHVAGAIGWWWW